MVNICRCCFPGPKNTNTTSPPRQDDSQSIVPSHSHQSTETPESSSVPSIRSIQNTIQEENTTEQIDELIKILDDVLLKIKGKGKEVSTSSGMEYLASTTRSASDVVDYVSKEVENISKLGICKDLGSVTTSLLNAVGATHFIFLGLSLVAFSLERYLTTQSNDSACIDLLEELIELTKEVKKFKEAVAGETEKVNKAIHEIVVGAVICCDYLAKGKGSRYSAAVRIESQLQERKTRIQNLRVSLTIRAIIHVADGVEGIGRQIAKRSVPSPSELLDFQPVGIEEQVEDVKTLLDIAGSDEAIAVVIVGFGGMGKSTLAASAIQSLNLSSTDFMFSKVTIDQKTPDKTSHITKLQSDIIFHFTGEAWDLQDTQQGRQRLQAAMRGKSCFLYVDNVVDSYYIKELLRRDFLPQKASEEKSESEKSKQNSLNRMKSTMLKQKASEEKSETENQMQKTKIRVLITSRQNDLKPLFNIKKFVHEFQKLHEEKAEALLRRTILQNKPAHDFEESKINELAKACRSVPLLLSVFGNHLKDNREKDSYEEAIKALNEGNIDRYGFGYEERLSEKLLFVYDQMRDEEAEEAFLDICTYLHGIDWNFVADIVDSATLATLHNKKLVNKSEKSTVIVHDILRLMGAKKAKDTRLKSYEEFLNINDDESKLKSVKGMILKDDKFLATLKTKHLNAMRHSLRLLVLGDWIRVEGPPCLRSFENLRYLEVGDLKDFPFKDVSQMEKLSVFWNGSKPGMELAQLPPSLKRLTHSVPYRDCNEFARLPLKNLKSLKLLTVETKKSVRFPEGFKLPASLVHLSLNSCEQLPETWGHLPALQTLSLDNCDLKFLPQEFTQSVHLRHLSLQYCTNMISLQDNNFASLRSLTVLRLTGCTRLEQLPADLGKLTALQHIDLRECENLRVLPENFGGLKSLKTLALDGCISLHRLPDRFGMLRIEQLNLQSLDNLKELPDSIGDLSCLQRLTINSCHSLEFFPDSFVQLTNLDALEVRGCVKLSALPNNFEQLCSLKKIILSECPLLTRLPDGFHAMKTLKYMVLDQCSSLVNLPASFEMLSCLEELFFSIMFFSSLPDGLGKLTKLKILSVQNCRKIQTLPQDFETLPTLEGLQLWLCPLLEGMTMDKIVKLHNCYYVDISRSTKLMERWNELKEVNKNLHMIVQTSENLDAKEMDRARRVGLLCGKCMELHNTTTELKHHSSMSLPNNTTVAVISLQLDQPQLFQTAVEMAKERATSNCGGQLRIIYVCRRSDDSAAPKEDDETETIRQALKMLPRGMSYAIPSTDIRRLSLIGSTMFDNPDVFNEGAGLKNLCFVVDVREDDEDHQIFKDGKCVTEDEIFKKTGKEIPLSENSDEENENSDGIVQFINSICENKTQRPSGQCSGLPEDNVVGEFIQNLKNNNIHHFSDNKVKVDHLQGKTVAIILIDQSYPECQRLQQIYQVMKSKDSNFEAIWIPLSETEDFGFGTYSRTIQCMPWLTLGDPKLIKIEDIKDKSPRVIIINSGGGIENPNALPLLMSWGADAYPFTKESLSQLDMESTLKIVFHSTEIKELNNKVIFLYAEPTSQKLEMKCTLEKLVQMHVRGNFEIIYVGCLFAEKNFTESLQKAYEDATDSMNWTKLSFHDMMSFWYRCKYLSDEMVHESNSASTLKSLLKALLNRERWLAVVDGDGLVTANGMDIVEMACELTDDDVEIMMKEELRKSLKDGKCREGVRRFFRDEINHPRHHHPLRTWKEDSLSWNNSFLCNRCDISRVYTSYGKRIYRCDVCNWDLCWDCWKEFVKEGVRGHPTQES